MSQIVPCRGAPPLILKVFLGFRTPTLDITDSPRGAAPDGCITGVISNFQPFTIVKGLHVTVGCGTNGGVTPRNY